MNRRPVAAFLDVNDTLSDLASVAPAFTDAGLQAGDERAWYLAVLRDGFAATVVGDNASYAAIGTDVARSMVRAAHPDRSDADLDAAAQAIMTAMVAAQPHADVVPGIVALAQAGVRVITLSNGSTDVARKLLGDTSAGASMDSYLSANDAGSWKPSPAAYRHGLRSAGVAGVEALMVAVHPWDLEGARRVGMRTAWINRTGANLSRAFRHARHRGRVARGSRRRPLTWTRQRWMSLSVNTYR
ncbi:haloacid dehalogenase type II [Williamsia sp. MIQD14]|uniref:haloacid dehalogenase type II n=1 Tax=Williamsia sp. MIQD14 TaxID=3425703 RepID=UPI003DA16ACF